MTERLERVKAELSELEAEARRAGADAREARERLSGDTSAEHGELAREHERVTGDLEEVRRASKDAWLALGQRTQRDVDLLSERVSRARRGPGTAGL